MVVTACSHCSAGTPGTVPADHRPLLRFGCFALCKGRFADYEGGEADIQFRNIGVPERYEIEFGGRALHFDGTTTEPSASGFSAGLCCALWALSLGFEILP